MRSRSTPAPPAPEVPTRAALPPWTPDLGALELLLSVAQLGSVGRAAAAHHISQPTASARLRFLERRLGMQLLVRSRRGSTLTPAGETVATWAAAVIQAARTLTDGVTALRGEQDVRLQLAASLTVAEYLLPGWLLAVRGAHADRVEIAARVANSNDVCDLVRTGAVELGFVEMPDVPEDLHSVRVAGDRLAVIVAPGHPLAGRAEVLAADLLSTPLLVREPGSGTREVFVRAVDECIGAFTPSNITELGSTAMILLAVRGGGGVGVVSERAARAGIAAGELVELRTSDLDLRRELRAVWRGDRLGALAEEVLTTAQEQG